MIDDGYTETFRGVSFRRLLAKERDYVSGLILGRQLDEAYSYLFSPPFVFCSGELDPVIANPLFEQLMTNPEEQADLRNLIDGVKLYCENPKLAVRTCMECLEWWFNEETGSVAKHGGRYLKRPPHAKPACETERGCPKGHHKNQMGMSEKNRKALNHYLEWNAVGCPAPECPTLRRNWMWIQMIFRKYGYPTVHAGVRGPEGQHVPV